jgi:hypothetical protein
MTTRPALIITPYLVSVASAWLKLVSQNDRKGIMTMRTAATVSLLAALISLSHGFIQSPSRASVKSVSTRRQGGRNKPTLAPPPPLARPILPLQRTHSVECFGFNLPPGKSNDNELSDILVGVAWIVGLIVFFASPLGGLFFAAVNSVFALLFLTPFILIVAFNTWQFFSTVQGNCPSCGAPIRVLKDGSPSICLNCKSVVRNDSSGRIDFAPPKANQFEQEESIFSIFDSTTKATKISTETRKDQYRREQTVIDVNVEDVDPK